MRLRRIAVAVIALVCLPVCIYLVCARVLAESYARQENRDVARNVQRAGLAFEELWADLRGKAIDWSKWDDGYRFMAGHNSAFLRTNLKVDIVMELGAGGRLRYARSVKRLDGIAPPAPESLVAALGIGAAPTGTSGAESGYNSIVPLPQCPIMVVVHPMSISDRPGSERRWVVVGRYFSPLALKQLADTTRLDIRAWPVTARDIPAAGREAIGEADASPTLIRPLDDRLVAGYAVLRDTRKHPALLLCVVEQRTGSGESARILGRMMPQIVVTLLGFGAFVLVALGRVFPSSLAKSAPPLEESRTALASTESTTASGGESPPVSEAIHDAPPAPAAPPEPPQPRFSLREAVEEATHDRLTDLPNRTLFMHRLEHAHGKAQRRNERLALVLIDVDNLDNIRVGMGAAAADELIVAVADRLTDHARPGDTVARLGGGEFTVLLIDGASGEGAVDVTQRMVTALDASIPVAGQGIFAMTSVGMAVRDAVAGSPQALLRNATTAKHIAKCSDTSGIVLFDPTMGDHVDLGIELESGLRYALEREELFLMYHPLIHLATGRVCGAEALLRWNHPTLGMVAPGEFVPIAEANGLILPIGYWALETACQQLTTWQARHAEFAAFTMNVNLSGRQLESPDVVDRVRTALHISGVNPAQVKLEITESVAMTDMEATVDRLDALRKLGVQLAMDDYGRGYSSLANLKAFPLDTVKIDRAFVRRLPEHGAAAGEIVTAIASLSKTLNMDVTAEGVETQDQATQLQRLGCDIGQGYLYARPLSAEGLEAFVTDRVAAAERAEAAKQARLNLSGSPKRESQAEAYYVPPKSPHPEG